MDLQIVTPHDGRTITAELVRNNMRVSNQTEDTLIEGYIDAAEGWISAEYNRPLLPVSYRLTYDQVYPKFALPRPPFRSFTSLVYQVENSDAVTVDTTGMEPRYQQMLPEFEIAALEDEPVHAGTMTIEWEAGYENAAAVPAPVKQAVLLLASHWFTHRGASHMDQRLMDIPKTIPFGVRDLLRSWRVPNVGDEQTGRY
ncbi:head-tail connector protein [Oceaniradius stylonematis]|uniref:head-tail connector protein n=1 Tax=Oceaniradius stylonematis TaxID=2184161 RepID=UPI00273FEA77|nr:head-tail connector protein [Oceaniradius stylonematis]